MIEFQNVMSLYQRAVSVEEDKLGLITSNIANQDTPGYKARDISFKRVMHTASNDFNNLQLKQPSNGRGMSGFGPTENYPVQYRVPTTDSLDGNTVDASQEKLAFMKNVVHYNSTMAFIQSEKTAFMQVIKGE